MSRMTKVDNVYYNETYSINFLEEIFKSSTNTGTELSPSYLFSSIMLPVRDFDSQTQKLKDTYTYYNVGVSPKEMSDIYWAQYSGNYLIGAGCGKTVVEDINKLTLRCTAIFKKFYGKYLKLIEMQGLEWNPLWNVDGTELRQILENEGVTDQTVEPKEKTLTHNTSSYDGTAKEEWNEAETGKVTTSYTHHNAKNIVNSEETDYTVEAGDTAFGYKLTGGDKMHVEKYLRQGNIGVTETTKLLEDAREYLKFNVIQEFFDDINKVILIGIYDY